jgi:adenine deaminase
VQKMKLDETVKIARGDAKADLLIAHARLVNVFNGEIETRNIALANGRIVGFGDYDAKEVLDVQGSYVAPGFIDPHVHIESSMLSITEFARAVVPFGTTTVIADPHEIANVLGRAGLDYMLASSAAQPMNIYYTLPSCVPATRMETSGADLSAEDLLPYLSHERIVALAEMMNFPGVIFADAQVLAKIDQTRKAGKRIDGHAPSLSGKSLNAYIAAGISSDHECTDAIEARDKLAAGMHIMVREGTCARNLAALLPVVNSQTYRRMMWCTDDRHPHDLLGEGHIDSIVRAAIDGGLGPVEAIQMATLHPAIYYGLHDIGAVAPGRWADLLIFEDLMEPVADKVFFHGRPVARRRRMLPVIKRPDSVSVPASMNVTAEQIDFSIPAVSQKIRVIDIVPDQVVTRALVESARIKDGKAVADPQRDLAKLAVIERHRGTGNVGLAFARGAGLKAGAIASSVAHDSHNIIVLGVDDGDMAKACREVVRMAGGLAAVRAGEVLGRLPLPIAGLMSNEPIATVRKQLDEVVQAAHQLGSVLKDPFMALSFLALPVIPDLKLTDLGLVDVKAFKMVSLFV